MLVSPWLILVVGLATVLGLMLLGRVHAFVALIMSGMVVSLLAPGPIGGKISRVAEAFGTTAGKIGVVIALAALVGKAMQESGAADRIVRSALRLFGPQRAAAALCLSGFILAIPVFFDTVFYLLVPLAYSLWRQTRKNYLLYLTAIAAGGVITHTLVPPTPGPLYMAPCLNIDLGVMILVGVILGAPVAGVALGVCHWMNRTMPIPMRLFAQQEQVSEPASECLPPLWLSVLPVVLPVLLISGQTVVNVWASGPKASPSGPPRPSGSPTETSGRWAGKETGRNQGVPVPTVPEAAARPVSGALASALSPTQTASVGAEAAPACALPDGLEGAESSDEIVILERLAPILRVIGDANLALLLSALIALGTLMVYRGWTLRQIAAASEEALTSAGVIILITSAGGAFGQMLGQSGLKEAVQNLFPQGGLPPMGVLTAAFLMASLLKVAQGSSTVAIMTTVNMFAAMGVGPEILGFHPVYLASTIAFGSLVGSWMNDSGFWIFAKMGGLTETESLRTWTVLLAVIGGSGFLLSLLASQLVPLI